MYKIAHKMDRRKFLSGLPASVAAVYAGKFLTGCGGAAPRTYLRHPLRLDRKLLYGQLNRRAVLAVVIASTSATEIFLISAITSSMFP